MKKLLLCLSILLSFSAVASDVYETALYEGDLLTFKAKEDIVIPAEKIEIKIGCGLLIKVDPKTRQRTFKKERLFKMSVASITRFWTTLDIEEGTTIFKSIYMKSKSFEDTKDLVQNCDELELLSIEAVEE